MVNFQVFFQLRIAPTVLMAPTDIQGYSRDLMAVRRL